MYLRRAKLKGALEDNNNYSKLIIVAMSKNKLKHICGIEIEAPGSRCGAVERSARVVVAWCVQAHACMHASRQPTPLHAAGHRTSPSSRAAHALAKALFLGLFSSKKICKIFQIVRHIESLDVCMKY